MNNDEIIENNKIYWNKHADLWFGTTELPVWYCDERKEVFENDKLVLSKSYYDESYFKMPVHDSEIVLCNRKISIYINALAKAGFLVEQMTKTSKKIAD